eukprot:jgi/Botrbrau1/6447/Bobra.0034s0023.2
MGLNTLGRTVHGVQGHVPAGPISDTSSSSTTDMDGFFDWFSFYGRRMSRVDAYIHAGIAALFLGGTVIASNLGDSLWDYFNQGKLYKDLYPRGDMAVPPARPKLAHAAHLRGPPAQGAGVPVVSPHEGPSPAGDQAVVAAVQEGDGHAGPCGAATLAQGRDVAVRGDSGSVPCQEQRLEHVAVRDGGGDVHEAVHAVHPGPERRQGGGSLAGSGSLTPEPKWHPGMPCHKQYLACAGRREACWTNGSRLTTKVFEGRLV